ncbi:lipopolysaccharide biosynthesis protein [Hydrogenophaga sp. R2]|uniref:lipopolysaccharide biosynthesis protein n=1 Tax=Hydrogenophaga sp. R2 TaxID=3132827 RepID=UPI003CF66034
MRLAQNFVANIAGSAITIGAGVIFLPFYLILLGAEAYGLIGFHTIVTGVVASMDTSFGQIANQFFSRARAAIENSSGNYAAFRSGENLAIGGAALTLLLIIALSGPISTTYFKYQSLRQAEVQLAIVLSGSSICLRWLQSYYSNVLAGLEKQVGINLVLSTTAIIQFGGGFLAIKIIQPSIIIFFEFILLIQLVSTLFLRKLACRQFSDTKNNRRRISPLEILSGRGFAAQVLGTNLMGAVISQSDKLIVGALTDMKTFGVYSFCATVASLILKLAAPVFATVYPRLSLLSTTASKSQELITSHHLACQIITILVVPSVGLLIFFPQEIILFWAGSHELASATYPMLSMLAVGNALNSMVQIPYALQLAHNWAKLAFTQNIVAVILFPPTVWWLASNFGTQGAALGWIGINLGYCVLGVYLMHRHLLRGEFFPWLKLDLLRPAAYSIPPLLVALSCDTSTMSRTELAAFLFATGFWMMCFTAIGAKDLLKFVHLRIKNGK